jgi:predicted DNA-binding transcriptional regulator AlpA
MAPQQNQPRHLRTREAATHCGVSTSLLEKFRLTGGGPAYSKLGKAVVYDVADLDEWISSRKRTSTSDSGIAA